MSLKKYSYLLWRVRIYLASLLLGEPIYKKDNQEIRHNIISNAVRIKWLTLKNDISKEDYDVICESCSIICGEADKVK